MKIIVGLGNPDKKYQDTRHNLGFKAVDCLAEKNNLNWQHDKSFNAEIAKGFNFYLVKPLTYMNNSGEAVAKIINYYHLLPHTEKNKTTNEINITESLTVIHDDLDIPLGSYKISTGGSSGGHNGIQSIIESLGTPNFTRVRLGVASENLEKARKSIWPGGVARFVLKKIPKNELEKINLVIAKVLEII